MTGVLGYDEGFLPSNSNFFALDQRFFLLSIRRPRAKKSKSLTNKGFRIFRSVQGRQEKNVRFDIQVREF